ncbi:hypothetical protein FJM67_08845 [Maribrevibacterium harenarium]|uniref:Motility protein n=1 Tax=Maribrevibacterium harenarium TaxID=2589817 RepID=A0A501WU27_9GAMM|nr:hypothetical protein [Maribrevibacterium harenarium]TPE51835.1 hypothetical protein FJM67_08845 [Maribrevibacterium harenarium]
MSSVSSASSSYGMEVLSASLAKSQQVQQGNQTLQLLSSTAGSAPQQTAPSSPVGNLGQNIDIKV